MSAAAAAASKYSPLALLLVLAALFVAAPTGAGAPAASARDREAPSAPGNVRVATATASTVSLTWDPSVDNVGVVGYDVVVYYPTSDGTRTRVSTTSMTVQGLECGSSVTVTVEAVDLARNYSTPASATVSTAACPDTQPPSAPSGFRQVATTQTAVVLAWDPATDNVGVTAYGVYKDLKRVASTPDPTVTLDALACGSGYTYQVDASDAAGNRSLLGTAHVETAACAAPAPQPAPPPSPTTSDWTFCAWENSECAFEGRKEVRYGANGVFTSPRQFDLRVACSNAVFGDPLVGTRKQCEYRQPPAGTPAPPPPPPSGETVWLSDVSWASATSGWGPVEKDRSNGERAAGDGGRLTLQGVTYDKGLGVHSEADIRYSVDGKCTRFRTSVGIDDEVGAKGSAVFEVYADGNRIGRTDSMTGASPTAEIDVSIAGAKELRLVVTNGGDNRDFDHADWAGARIECANSSTSPQPSPPPPPQPSPPPPSGDTTPPSPPTGLGVTAATPTSVSLGWGSSTDNVGVQGYGVYKAGSYVSTTSETRATVSQLTCNSAAQFEVDAYDAAGNRSTRAAVTASTTACSDTQPPSAPTGLFASSRTATSIALSWSAASDNVGVAGYTLYRNGVVAGTSASTTGIFSGLTCNANYTLAIDAYDGAGNHSPKTTVLVATTACPDTTPPSAPTGLAVSGVTQTSLDLAWNASTDNVGVTGYDVYRNGTKMTTVTATSSAQTGLTCGNAVTLGVVAVDAAGNRSQQSQTTASTSPCATPSEWTSCATEGQQCAFSGARDVRYGANGIFTAPRTFSDGVQCSNSVFGDPVVGVTKHCEIRASTGSPSLTPPPLPSSGAVTISQGGTYTGNWAGNGSGPAVRIATTQPVVIQNSVIRNAGGANLVEVGAGANVTVRGTTLEGAAGATGKAVYGNGFNSVRVENCTIVGTWGIRLDGIQAGGSVVVTRNKARNIVRAGDLTHFYQAANWSATPSVHEISWNEVIGDFGVSGVEDIINIYGAGSARIHDNYLEGAYPSTAGGGFSGSGIMLDSGAHDNEVWSNIIVETTNAGIGIASGWNNKVHNNKIVFDGKLDNGTALAASNVGLYVWNYDANANWRGNEAWANDVGWRKADGSRNDWWLPNCSGACSNTALPNPVDGSTELAAFQEWQARLAGQGVSIGA